MSTVPPPVSPYQKVYDQYLAKQEKVPAEMFSLVLNSFLNTIQEEPRVKKVAFQMGLRSADEMIARIGLPTNASTSQEKHEIVALLAVKIFLGVALEKVTIGEEIVYKPQASAEPSDSDSLMSGSNPHSKRLLNFICGFMEGCLDQVGEECDVSYMVSGKLKDDGVTENRPLWIRIVKKS
jgi:hypothetical protein